MFNKLKLFLVLNLLIIASWQQALAGDESGLRSRAARVLSAARGIGSKIGSIGRRGGASFLGGAKSFLVNNRYELIDLAEFLVIDRMFSWINARGTDAGISQAQIAFLGFIGACGIFYCRFAASDILVRLNPKLLQLKKGSPAADFVNEVCAGYELPVVDVYVIKGDYKAGAFNVGSNAIILPHGAFWQWRGNELKAILAHELGHYKHKDNLVVSFWLALIQGFTSVIGRFVVAKYFLVKTSSYLGTGYNFVVRNYWQTEYCAGGKALLQPLIALLNRFVRRPRELRADQFAKSLNYGPDLASALKKLDNNPPRYSGIEEILIRWGGLPLINYWNNNWRIHPPTVERCRALGVANVSLQTYLPGSAV